MAKEKSRYFIFLLYPDSLPDDWEIKLETIGVPIAISPLHDKDLSGINQGYKKAHYHVIYVAKNPVTCDSVRKKLRQVLGDQSVALVKIPVSVENCYLYLTHESKDAIAKNKHIYDKSNIKLINNFDIERYISLDAGEKDKILDDICNIIANNNLSNILELKDFVENRGSEYGLPSMNLVHKIIRSHTGLIRLYFDGVYQNNKFNKTINIRRVE